MKRRISLGILLFALQAAAEVTPFSLAGSKIQPDVLPRGKRIAVDGQIMLVCDGHPRRVTIMDRQKPKTLTFWDEDAGDPPYRSGDLVSAVCVISGSPPAARRETPKWTNAFLLAQLTVVASNQPPPRAISATARELNANDMDGHFTAISGIVSSVLRDPTNQGWLWIMLRADGGTVRAAATEHDYSFAELRALVNAKVRLAGIPVPFYAWRSHLGYHLVLFGSGGLEVLKPAKKPFDAPRLTSASIYCHQRQQISGTVLGTDTKRIFLNDDCGQFLTVLPQEGSERPLPGERVTVSGFSESAPLGIQLANAVLRRDAPGRTVPLPTAREVDPERMFAAEPERELADATLYGKVIRVRGLADDAPDAIRANGRFSLRCGRRTLSVDVSGLEEPIPDGLDAGSTVEVSGICLADFDTNFDTRMFPTFRGFELVPRTAADIVVVRRPPFWTARRLTGVIVVLALGLLAILVWNVLLRALSKRRGELLYRERFNVERARLKVEERTRLAVELHDAISQTLTGVALQLDAVNRFADSDRTKMGSHLGIATRMLKSCRDELRNCLWDLRNRALEESDMNVAIRRTVNPFVGEAKLVIRFNISRDQLSDDAAHTLLRIIRELASNAVRHGQATVIRIAGALENGRLLFSVSDNGSGFDPDSQPSANEGHFGLDGIRERIERLSGTMEISSSRGRGTAVTISILA